MLNTNKKLTPRALALAALLSCAAAGVGLTAAPTLAAADDTSRVWVEGHNESRESSQLVPAQTRREWVPARYERVTVPEVNEKVYIPPVTKRVRQADVTERVWVPEVTEPYWQHGYFDLGGWHAAHWEDRVVTRGHYENRVVAAGGYEDRVVAEGRWIDKVVTPARTESRVAEDGYWREVVVRSEHYETTSTNVWVPGHWEDR